MLGSVNRQIVLKSRPEGAPSIGNFELMETPTPEPGEGEVLMRIIYLSLDPYMRGRMSAAKSYATPAAIGQPLVGGTVGEIVESRNPNSRLWRLAELLEDCSRGISQAGALLPHLEALPQDEGEKAHEDMGLSAIFALVPDRTDVQLIIALSDDDVGARADAARFLRARAGHFRALACLIRTGSVLLLCSPHLFYSSPRRRHRLCDDRRPYAHTCYWPKPRRRLFRLAYSARPALSNLSLVR